MSSSQPSKKIVITDHAGERMAKRGISHNMLANTVRRPTVTMAGNSPYTKRLEREFPPKRRLIVIVEETDEAIKIVW